jgi:hypothetical protein
LVIDHKSNFVPDLLPLEIGVSAKLLELVLVVHEQKYGPKSDRLFQLSEEIFVFF